MRVENVNLIQRAKGVIMITFKQHGNFNHTENFLNGAKKLNVMQILDSYGQQGVVALSSATPKDTGLTSESWGYTTDFVNGVYKITWTNSNDTDGIPLVILLQYGHATRDGSFVEGNDFINPAIKPVLDQIAENLWKEVSQL